MIVRTECVEGNNPECPFCGNWNALLERSEYSDEGYKRYYYCRDCGREIDSGCLEIHMKELDKPGMGSASTYTLTGKVFRGKDF